MSTTSESIPPTEEKVFARVAWALRRADLNLQSAKERPLRALGLSNSHYSALVSLQINPGITGAELARTLGVTPQAVTLLVAKLSERGLVERRTHPRHQNVLELHLTAAGRNEVARAERIVQDLEHHIRTSLGEHKYTQLRTLLGSVIEAIPAWTPPSDE